MNKHSEFPREVISSLKYYVYRLVDPRNGQTFYVGKGTGNRVFEHAKAVDYSFYSKKDILTSDDIITDENDDPAKVKIIKQIRNDGLDVIHIIQRWGLTEKEAFEIEASFIDYFSLQQLSNKVKGHHSERGMYFTDKLIDELCAEEFVDNENNPRYLIIKIKDYWINYNHGDIYETVRHYWKINPNKANNYPYVLAVKNGVVVGVFKINENGWQYRLPEKDRSYFEGEEAPDEIKKMWLNKKIPSYYIQRGKANPCLFCKY